LVTGYSSDAGNLPPEYTSDYFSLLRIQPDGSMIDPLVSGTGSGEFEFGTGNYRSGANALGMDTYGRILMGGFVNTSGNADEYDMALVRLAGDLAGIEEETAVIFSVYPNPASDYFRVESSSGIESIE